MRNIQLRPLEEHELPEFKQEMQRAFQYGYEKEYGPWKEEILPGKDIDESLNSDGAAAYIGCIDGEMVGGAVVNINVETQHNHLDFLFVKVGSQSKGAGHAIWQALEAKYPATEVWKTCTPYFEKRNIHFYVNICGFHIVEFYNPRHQDPRQKEEAVGGMPDEAGSFFFEFEKHMNPKVHLSDFATPPAHIHFLAKKYPELADHFQDGALAYLEPNGGGPMEKHSHSHDHLFLVIQGEARIEYDKESVVVKAHEIYRVSGCRKHSVWNNGNTTAIMLGLTIAPKDEIPFGRKMNCLNQTLTDKEF